MLKRALVLGVVLAALWQVSSWRPRRRSSAARPTARRRSARVTARLEPSVPVATGGRLALAADPARFHFFDPQTERALRA
jgi:hypothetical protein